MLLNIKKKDIKTNVVNGKIEIFFVLNFNDWYNFDKNWFFILQIFKNRNFVIKFMILIFTKFVKIWKYMYKKIRTKIELNKINMCLKKLYIFPSFVILDIWNIYEWILWLLIIFI